MSEREQAAWKAHKKASESAWKAFKERIAWVWKAYVEATAKTGGGFEVR